MCKWTCAVQTMCVQRSTIYWHSFINCEKCTTQCGMLIAGEIVCLRGGVYRISVSSAHFFCKSKTTKVKKFIFKNQCLKP